MLVILSITVFCLSAGGVLLLLRLTLAEAEENLVGILTSDETLRDRSLDAQGKKRRNRIGKKLLYIKSAMEACGKGRLFSLLLVSAPAGAVAGGVLAVVIDNLFLAPVLVCGLFLLPFFVGKRVIAAYEKSLNAELETSLSIITTSYLRTDDLVKAIRENIQYIKPPLRTLFEDFVTETKYIYPDVRLSLSRLRGRLDNDIFREWCDQLLACQDDSSFKDTLLPIVGKLTDVRLVNSELETLLQAPKREYLMMVAMLAMNIPLLYVLNREWYEALTVSVPGKFVLAICAVTVAVTFVLMLKYTKPIEYRR